MRYSSEYSYDAKRWYLRCSDTRIPMQTALNRRRAQALVSVAVYTLNLMVLARQ